MTIGHLLTRGVMALACPVCVGASDGPMAQASNAGIATLMAVTLVVLAGIASVAISIARRARIAARTEAAIAPASTAWIESASVRAMER
jgi:hypothetical protein